MAKIDVGKVDAMIGATWDLAVGLQRGKIPFRAPTAQDGVVADDTWELVLQGPTDAFLRCTACGDMERTTIRPGDVVEDRACKHCGAGAKG